MKPIEPGCIALLIYCEVNPDWSGCEVGVIRQLGPGWTGENGGVRCPIPVGFWMVERGGAEIAVAPHVLVRLDDDSEVSSEFERVMGRMT